MDTSVTHLAVYFSIMLLLLCLAIAQKTKE